MNQQNNKYIKNDNINSPEIKNKILKYLLSKIPSKCSNYEFIKNNQDLMNIKNNDYIICPRYSGTRAWILFFHIDDNYYAVSFPKHAQYKREKLLIHPIDINVNKKFYAGTIMEGIYFKMGQNHHLQIDEVYVLCGENQLLKSKDDRLNYLMQNIKMATYVNQYYSMTITPYYIINKNSIQDLFYKIKDNPSIQEIIFYPKIYGNKIYKYVITDADVIDDVVTVHIFKIQKTAKPDVYNLFHIKSDTKVDIAYIPNINTSKKCKKWFIDHKTNELLVKCKMDYSNKKWIPIEIIESDL